MTEKNEKQSAEKADSKVADQVASVVEEETKQGFRGGPESDSTPNFNYTVEGVTSGAPTPETDHDQAVEVSGNKVTKFSNKGQLDS